MCVYVCVYYTTQEFSGNVNHDKESRHYLRSPVVARYVRIHPVEWHRQIGLRAGLFGCPQIGTRHIVAETFCLYFYTSATDRCNGGIMFSGYPFVSA